MKQEVKKETFLPEEVSHTSFFSSLNYFYDEVKNINQILLSYSSLKGLTCEKEFFALLLKDNKVSEITDSILYHIKDISIFKEEIEMWIDNESSQITIVDGFYKIDAKDVVLLFKVFNEPKTPHNKVVAGYIIPDNLNSRMLLFSLINQSITLIKEQLLQQGH